MVVKKHRVLRFQKWIEDINLQRQHDCHFYSLSAKCNIRMHFYRSQFAEILDQQNA